MSQMCLILSEQPYLQDILLIWKEESLPSTKMEKETRAKYTIHKKTYHFSQFSFEALNSEQTHIVLRSNCLD